MRKYFSSVPLSYFLFLSLFSLVILLLIGNRLGFRFAGGDGYQRPLFFQSDTESFSRGSTIDTGAGERMMISQDQLFVWLDENSTLHVDTLTNDETKLTLIRGRMVAVDKAAVKRATTIVAGDTTTTSLDAPISIVNYDFLGKVDVFPVEETLATTGAAKDFYAWYFSTTK